MPRPPSPSPALPVLDGAILVGGRAERMGQPKALLRFGDQTLFARVVAALRPRVARLYAVGAGELPAGFEQTPRLTDAPHVDGPLAGILAALRSTPASAWLVAACDLPLITEEAVAWLCAQRAPDRIAVLPRVSARGVEPLLAIYEPGAREPLETLAARGVRAPRHLVHVPGVASPEAPPALAPAWTNVNRPEDLALLSRS